MKSRLYISTLYLALSLISGLAQAESASRQRANDILNEIDDLWRGQSSHAVADMTVHTARYTRTLEMEIWSRGKDDTLVRILAPLKEKDSATLKSGASIYTYLPKIDRTIRLTSGMMSGSWMGSHFTNDDLVKESRMVDDYDADITYEGQRDGREVLEFTLIPKPDAAVVWGKITLLAQKEPLIPIEEIYYDEDMQVARTMSFSGVKELGGQPRPALMRLTPEDKPAEYTEIHYSELELNIPVDEGFFSLSRLKRTR